MEHYLLTEQQQKRVDPINRMIARGEMPSNDELRAARCVLACGCPEQLLRSVVAKNAVLTRSRTTRRTAQPKDGAFILFEGRKRWITNKELDEIGAEVWRYRHDRKRLDRVVAKQREQYVLAESAKRRRLLLDL